jgi:hypothetical protein
LDDCVTTSEKGRPFFFSPSGRMPQVFCKALPFLTVLWDTKFNSGLLYRPGSGYLWNEIFFLLLPIEILSWHFGEIFLFFAKFDQFRTFISILSYICVVHIIKAYFWRYFNIPTANNFPRSMLSLPFPVKLCAHVLLSRMLNVPPASASSTVIVVTRKHPIIKTCFFLLSVFFNFCFVRIGTWPASKYWPVRELSHGLCFIYRVIYKKSAGNRRTKGTV